jgi:predicted protein tyrosine phosphatase
MEIEIHNYLSCSHLLETESGDWDSIVILDSSLPRSKFVDQHSRRTLQLTFDDIIAPTANKSVPDHSQVESALEFGLNTEKLVVCCRAGQSRSAATAFAIVFEKHGGQDAISILNPKRHSPNYKILQIAAELIERPGLLNAYDKWGYDVGDTRLTDHLDEIESEYDQLESIGARDRISRCP